MSTVNNALSPTCPLRAIAGGSPCHDGRCLSAWNTPRLSSVSTTVTGYSLNPDGTVDNLLVGPGDYDPYCYQNIPGGPITASYTATNAQIAPSLNRNLGQCRGAATCSGTVTIANLFEPNTLFGERIQQIDIRTNKRFQMGHVRVAAKFDVYNITNNNVVLAINTV